MLTGDWWFVYKKYFVIFIIFLSVKLLYGQEESFIKKNSFNAVEAKQAVAVDDKYIYVIDNNRIGQYDKNSFKLVNKWVAKKDDPVKHLNSGVVINGKLYCAHSNYPNIPMTSSIEIWDTKNLQHTNSHSFGISWGSCTWIDKLNNNWYVGFAQYNKWKTQTGKGTEWSVIVKFNSKWQFLESWTFPDSIIKRFGQMSNSGASFGKDGLLYCTGHDAKELYVLKIPEFGSTMQLVKIIKINNPGQGIAWDRNSLNDLYCIDRDKLSVNIFGFIKKEKIK